MSKTILIGIETGRFQNRLSSLLRVGSHLVDRRRCKNLVPGWVNGHRRGAKKNKGAGDVTLLLLLLLLYYYYVHRKRENERNLVRFFYIFLFDFVPASALPLDTRDALLPMLLFSTGGEGGGVTHNGACNNEYLRITFWAKKTGGGAGGGG